MACECESTSCIDVYLDACAASITLPIAATGSGTYQMMAEFNGANIRRAVTVTNGENITVPNVFNLDYTHTIKFYKPDGTVLNETCYKLRTMPTIFPNAAPPVYDWIDTGEDYTMDATTKRLLVFATEQALTVTIPDGLLGEFVIRRAHESTFNVLLVGNIDDASGETLTPVSESLTFSWDENNGQYNTI